MTREAAAIFVMIRVTGPQLPPDRKPGSKGRDRSSVPEASIFSFSPLFLFSGIGGGGGKGQTRRRGVGDRGEP